MFKEKDVADLFEEFLQNAVVGNPSIKDLLERWNKSYIPQSETDCYTTYRDVFIILFSWYKYNPIFYTLVLGSLYFRSQTYLSAFYEAQLRINVLKNKSSSKEKELEDESFVCVWYLPTHPEVKSTMETRTARVYPMTTWMLVHGTGMMSFWSNMSFDLIPSSVSLEKHGNHAVDLDTGEVKFKDKAYWNASKTVLGENTNAREKARAYEIRSRFLIETTKK